MSDSAKVQPGELYCVFCLGERLSMRITRDMTPTWDCDDCHREYEHPFHADADGRFAWTWDDKHLQPNAGCPWCGTCNIRGVHVVSNGDGQFVCRRQSCGKYWRGGFTLYDYRENGGIRWFRWKIHVPVETVPWASGTTADLECYRRGEFWGFLPGVDARADGCCRWPKSCSAFDPGFTVGKGRTTLPIVWFDGFGWRSGLPDLTKIPQHLLRDIWFRWLQANPVEEANDDDGDGERDAYDDTFWDD